MSAPLLCTIKKLIPNIYLATSYDVKIVANDNFNIKYILGIKNFGRVTLCKL